MHGVGVDRYIIWFWEHFPAFATSLTKTQLIHDRMPGPWVKVGPRREAGAEGSPRRLG